MKKILFIIACILSQFAYSQSVNVLLFKEKMLISASEADSVTFAIVPTQGEYIDMGLPSGTLWASCNIGATKPEEYGNYYAWGEVTTKYTYNWDTYKYGYKANKYPWYHLTKYCDSQEDGDVDYKSTLEDSDDVAYVLSNGEDHMPTSTQIIELTNPEYTMQSASTLNGVDGYIIFSKINGNSLFFPKSGYKDTKLWDAGKNLMLWGKDLYVFCGAGRALCDSEGKLQIGSQSRDYGHPVRAVRDKK